MYSRVTCGLCDRAREEILSLRDQVSFEYEEIFIDGREDLEREYGLRIPVVSVEGEELFQFEVDRSELRSRLAGAAGRLRD
jgi:hypothetical protein